VAVIISCNKTDNDIEEVNVYVAGRVDGVATVWKNRVAQNLTDGTYSAEAISVFVSGRDIYVAGWEASGQEYQMFGTNRYSVAKLWKNGVAQNLTDGTNDASAHSVFVSGKDVYVVGIDNNLISLTNRIIGTLWKNGVRQNLITDGSSSVFVSGNDVYKVGGQTWKNDVVLYNNGGSSIFVSGNDVYVAGNMANPNALHINIATLWKNGVVQNLTDDTNSTWGVSASSVFVSGNDVYVVGSDSDAGAVLWKNGVRQNLTEGSRWAYAYSVFVK
jgi:hypothetical protein